MENGFLMKVKVTNKQLEEILRKIREADNIMCEVRSDLVELGLLEIEEAASGD